MAFGVREDGGKAAVVELGFEVTEVRIGVAFTLAYVVVSANTQGQRVWASVPFGIAKNAMGTTALR